MRPGHLHMALGDNHILIGTGERFLPRTRIDRSPPEHGCRPSINPMFHSVAQTSLRAAAFLLTGMGSDGAEGLLALKTRGARTFIQDRDSCVVYGMPRAALALGSAEFESNPETLRECLMKTLKASLR